MAQILVLDDEPNNRLLLGTILEFGGYEFVEASNAADALRAARARRPDLVIMDLHMPGMSGADFLKELRADPALSRVKVALYTATSCDDDLRQFMEVAGIEHIIPKPSDPSEVLRIVGAIVSAG